MGVDSTTYLADAKIVYGTLEEQVSTQAAIVNLFQAGNKFGKPINQVGLRGYQILCRLTPNWRMGFRKEGVTGVGQAGNQGLKNATVVLKYCYVPIIITGQAENLTKGEKRAFMQAKALEAKFDMKDVVSHLNVIIAGCQRGGELARVSSAGGEAPGPGTFYASNSGNLPGAIYLRKGMPIDTVAVGGGVRTVNDSVISAINYSSRLVTHAAGTALAGEAVALHDEYPLSAADFPMTAECLVSLISDTGAIQGLDPANAGEGAWASFVKDNGGNAISSSLIEEVKQFVKNRSGEKVDMILMPSAQINSYVAIATATLRYDVQSGGVGKKALDLGFTVYSHGGDAMIEDKDLLPDRFYPIVSDKFAKFEALPLSMAEDEAGSWTRVSGTNGIADAVQGLLRWYIQLGTLQRSAAGVCKNNSVPGSFLTAAPTL